MWNLFTEELPTLALILFLMGMAYWAGRLSRADEMYEATKKAFDRGYDAGKESWL